MHAKKNKSFATTELAGRVVAPAGVPVAGVIVSLENLATHQRREAESTVEGTFQLQQIFAGNTNLPQPQPAIKPSSCRKCRWLQVIKPLRTS